MATTTFKLFGLPVDRLITRVREIIGKMTDAVAVYVTPDPTVVVMTAAVDKLDASNQASQNGDRLIKKQRNIDRKVMLQKMSMWQAYIQSTSGGDAAKILLVADVKKGRSPVGIKPAPGKIRLYFGYDAGEIRLVHGGVKGRTFYRVQINAAPLNPATWADYAQTTKVQTLIKGLVSGAEYGIRIATVTVDGQGDWSDTVLQKAL
ncbi:MAG: fibronectin type III domain-containing protein [Bacteroidia bacterium]